MNKDKYKQINFFVKDEVQEKPKIKITPPYDATICYRCKCNMCVNNVEYEMEKMTKEELQNQEPCFNCDECYFYGMDDSNLNQHAVRFECKNFKILKYYVDLNAGKQRQKIKIVR